MDEYSEAMLANELSTYGWVQVTLTAPSLPHGLLGVELLWLDVYWEGIKIPFNRAPEINLRSMGDALFVDVDTPPHPNSIDERRKTALLRYLKELKCKLVLQDVSHGTVNVQLQTIEGPLPSYFDFTALALPADH